MIIINRGIILYSLHGNKIRQDKTTRVGIYIYTCQFTTPIKKKDKYAANKNLRLCHHLMPKSALLNDRNCVNSDQLNKKKKASDRIQRVNGKC